MRFVSLLPSTRPNKKYVIHFQEPNKTIHFGSKKSSTYLDHHDKLKRHNYLARHSVNEDWENVNAGSLSAIILWGKTTDLHANLKYFLDKFNIEHY
jgi:hypothetical protein